MAECMAGGRAGGRVEWLDGEVTSGVNDAVVACGRGWGGRCTDDVRMGTGSTADGTDGV